MYFAISGQQPKGQAPPAKRVVFEARRIFILARKAYSVIFELGFVLCVIGLASSIAQAWSPPCEISCNEQSWEWNQLREPNDCCEGVNESSCCLFKGCCSESSAMAVSVVSKAENRQYADSAIDGIHVIPVSDFLIINDNMAEPSVTGPPVSLFLKNLSLLC
jgi:hypothetical protein